MPGRKPFARSGQKFPRSRFPFDRFYFVLVVLAPIGGGPAVKKTLGERIAEADGSACMSAAILGHRNLRQVELYSREANKNQPARDGLARCF